MCKLICATKCSNNHMHPQIHSQDSLHFTITLAVLRGAALPHFKRGSPDPLGASSVSLDPLGAGSISPDPRSRAPSRPTPRSRAPSRPTPRSRALARPNPRSRASTRPTLWSRAPSRLTPRSWAPACLILLSRPHLARPLGCSVR